MNVGYQDYLWGLQTLFGIVGLVEECYFIKLHASDTSTSWSPW